MMYSMRQTLVVTQHTFKKRETMVDERERRVGFNENTARRHRRACITKRKKAESEAQRGTPKGKLESEIRSAISLLGQRPPRYTGCGNVVIDRRGDQLGDGV